MTRLSPSVYNKRNKLLRKSKSLELISLDGLLSFDKYMDIRKKQDKIYQKWKFYDKMIKLLNKKEPK